MPRKVTTVTILFKYDELPDEAKGKAVQQISEKLTGPWWDSHDDEALAEVMMWALAHELRTPGVSNYGPGDFPGIDGIKLAGYDMGRGQMLTYKGHLTRDTAPALPWADGIDSVALSHPDYTRTVEANIAPADDGPEVPGDAIDAIVQATRDAIYTAWKAGRDEHEHMHSEEYARDWIEGNEPEFLEDGTLA